MRPSTILAWTAVGVVLGSAAVAQEGQSERWETPRAQLALSAGVSVFRGGEPDGSVIRFQPDTEATTGAAGLSFALARHVALELELAATRSQEEDGFATPESTLYSAGLRLPWPVVGRGRLVPYVSLGGGVVDRQTRDGFDGTLEQAFGMDALDPQAYAGAGIEFRLTRLLGLRADYRYHRIFPDRVEDLDLERDSFGVHRASGALTFSF